MQARTFISLFSGIGGIDLGLERAGWRCVAQVEIDPFCRRVLAKHWPDVPKFEDVRTFGREKFDGAVDLIAGGFPCQDISRAGRREGIEAERSGLWGEYVRIVRELRPSLVLVENVAALLDLERGKPAPIGRVLGDLAACGYDAEWDCIPAAAVGALHLRDRAFIVAYPDRQRREEQHAPALAAGSVFPDRLSDLDADGHQAGREQNPDEEEEGRWVPDLSQRFGLNRGPWRSEPHVARVVHGVPNRVDRLRGLGNAVVPQVAEWIGRRLLDAMEEVPVG